VNAPGRLPWAGPLVRVALLLALGQQLGNPFTDLEAPRPSSIARRKACVAGDLRNRWQAAAFYDLVPIG
jgi:hypothetical protein